VRFTSSNLKLAPCALDRTSTVLARLLPLLDRADSPQFRRIRGFLCAPNDLCSFYHKSTHGKFLVTFLA